jgi:thiol-disulfide isomerase/thioredoxin
MKTPGIFLCLLLALSFVACSKEDVSTQSAADAPQERGNIYDATADGSKQIAEALNLARKSDKNVLLQFGGDWCVPCLKLHRLFETNTTINETLRADYVVVHVEYNERNDHLVTTYRARQMGLPFLVILDSGGGLLTTKNTQDFEEAGQHRPEQVLAFLKEWTPAAMRAKPIAQWVREFIEKPAYADATIELDHIRRKPTEAVPCLIEVIKTRPTSTNSESRWAARIRACDALVSIAPKTAVPLLAEQFISDSGLRDHLRVILSKLGPDAKEAIPTLINAFRSSELDLQFRAAWVLAHVDPQNSELVPKMVTLLGSTNVVARRGATWVLGEIGPAAKSAISALVAASSDSDETVRKRATNAIARIGVE